MFLKQIFRFSPFCIFKDKLPVSNTEQSLHKLFVFWFPRKKCICLWFHIMNICNLMSEFSLYRYVLDNGRYREQDTGNDHTFNVWYHVTLVYNATARELLGYRDAVELATRTSLGTGEQIYDDDGRLVIGQEYTHLEDDYASVTVDELMFFDRPLHENEINEIYMFYQRLGI